MDISVFSGKNTERKNRGLHLMPETKKRPSAIDVSPAEPGGEIIQNWLERRQAAPEQELIKGAIDVSPDKGGNTEDWLDRGSGRQDETT